MALGIIGILVALILFLILVYKGVSTFIIAPVCAIIVAVTNSLDPVDAFYTFASGLGEMIVSLFAVIFLGAVLGKVFTETGCALSIAKTLNNKFLAGKSGPAQVRIAILIMIVISAVMTLGGIDGFVLMFSTFPIAMVIAELANIPRRFVPGMLCLNCAFMTMPGSPQIDNIAMVQALQGEGYDITAKAGMIPGYISCILIVVLAFFSLTTMIIKAQKNGEVFDWGQVEKMDPFKEGRKLPHFVIALLPLVCVFVMYTILELDVAVALASGIVLCLILSGRYIEKKPNEVSIVKRIVGTLNRGGDSYPNALTTVATPSGLASVVTSTAAFGVICTALASLDLSPVWLTVLVICVVVAITSAPPVALYVGLPIIVGILAQKGIEFNVEAVGRVAAIAASTFETLPVNGMCVVTIALARSTYRDSYKAMFFQTVLWTFVGTVVCAVLCSLFPGIV